MSGHRFPLRPCFLAISVFLASCEATPVLPPAPADEASVRPDVNKRFLAKDLDLDWAVGTFEAESREIFASRAAIVAALELEPGDAVADVGAGTGLFFAPLSQAVGPEGRVIGVDLAPRMIEFMQRRVAESGFSNVDVVQCTERSVELDAASVDVLFSTDTYHHFEYPRSTLASIARALRSGGTMVVIDFERVPGKSRDWILNHVRTGKEEVIAEVTAAGFVYEGELTIDGLEENYAIRFRRP